jgi:hypothetical protein
MARLRRANAHPRAPVRAYNVPSAVRRRGVAMQHEHDDGPPDRLARAAYWLVGIIVASMLAFLAWTAVRWWD